MRYIIFILLLLSSCITTEYHAASPLTKANRLDMKVLNKFNVNYKCPKDNDQLLCTYAEMLLTDKGYVKDQPEGKQTRPKLNIKITATKIKDYDSGNFDFALWIFSITTWPYESQTFFKIDISVSTQQKIRLKDSFYAHYSNNYSWVYTLSRWISGKLDKDTKPSMEEAGSKDLYDFIEKSIAQSVGYIDMETF